MKDLTKEIVSLTKHKNIDERVIDYIDKLISSLQQNNVEINDYTKLIIMMIVNELILYFKASDVIYDNDDISSKDNYDRKAKMPEISILQKAHDQILTLMDKISASPLSRAKIHKLKQNSTDKELDAEDAFALLKS